MQSSTNGLSSRQILGGSSHGNYRKYIHHYEQLQKLLDAYKTRQASLQFRHNVLKHQRKNNYQLEYDRIRGVLGSNLIPNTTKERIRERLQELQQLGAKAVNRIED
jgi:hypothetical protein